VAYCDEALWMEKLYLSLLGSWWLDERPWRKTLDHCTWIRCDGKYLDPVVLPRSHFINVYVSWNIICVAYCGWKFSWFC